MVSNLLVFDLLFRPFERYFYDVTHTCHFGRQT